MSYAIDELIERAEGNTLTQRGTLTKSPQELAAIVQSYASSELWLERVRLRADHRWYERVFQGADHDIWIISWMPGQSTGFHDHGESSGAFVVASGILEEHRPGGSVQPIYAGELRAFDSDYAHDVRNSSSAPAISIHAYSPPLSEMNEYELDGNRLIQRHRQQVPDRTDGQELDGQNHAPPADIGPSGIDRVLSMARSRIRRLAPHEAYEAFSTEGAILVDIRPESQRAAEGKIPGALIVERNVLEWRFDPTSETRLPLADRHDLAVIVFCSEGYTSSLAAASLLDLGLWRATDIVGGFHAWRKLNLPTLAPTSTT